MLHIHSHKSFWLILIAWTILAGASNRRRYLSRRHIHALKFAPFCKFDDDIINNRQKIFSVVQNSKYVFSGRVISDLRYGSDNKTILFDVYVKRFFKNPGDIVNRKELTVSKVLQEGEGTKCRQVVRFRYTAIFIGRKPEDDQNADVHLTISPVSITLTNLDTINAASKDIAHKPRQQFVEEPCEKTFCNWGAQCVIGADGRPFCQCPTHCRTFSDPVCGTDGKTYVNQCQLRVSSCRARQNTRVKYAGECEQSNPCRDKQCGFGARCVATPDGRNASCQCPEKCPNYGDHSASRPVCGSDGVDYKDQCELRKAACNTNSNITIKFSGKCDPCAGVECAEPEVCQLDEHRNPVCRCGDTCPLEFTPVCGSDGKTYSNECSLRQEACRARKTLNIIYRGKCSSGVNPCLSVRCTLGEECAINKYGIARCECPPACEPVMRPVCSEDGRTYPSECELKRSACIARAKIEVAYTGVCGEMGPCSDHECHFGATCVERSGVAHCECPVCPAEFEPVCGSDGISYGNECKLRLEACKHRREIRVLYDGPCNGCENKKCDFYSTCESDGATEGRCVCPQTCKDDKLTNGPVCGTDGVTYANECELRIASCKTKQYVLVAYKGDCDLCKDKKCEYGGRCEAGECVCPTNCEGIGDEPVCSSNMMTYPNECELQKAACLQPTEAPPLSVVFYGDCRERFPVVGALSMEVKPCNGEKPLIDPATGRELDCGNGPSRQDCPSGSYCHQTTRFARCCHKDQSLFQQKSCEDSFYGCCPDGKTPAQGPDHAGCPSLCGCNKLGSYSDTCDPETQQCRCRPGVGGEKCDRCEPGYWGLPKISSGHHGCIPCGCSSFGSVRDDCEQMTGRCVCKPGIQGQKCTICTSHDKILGPNGCVAADLSTPPPTTCKELTCHFGANCMEKGGLAVCDCHTECPEENDPQIVCGSDGQTYSSACQLRSVACRNQKDVVVQAFGMCKEDMFPGTDWPVRRYTPLQFTQPDDSNSPLSKSTRHLAPDPRYYYERSGSLLRPPQGAPYPADPDVDNNASAENNLSAAGSDNIYNTRGGNYAAAYRPTPATVRVTALLGDLCSDNSDCFIMYSSCVRGACTCLPNYIESPDRQECIVDATPTDEYRACSSSPCGHGSTCVDLPSATFTCLCNTNQTGLYCETEIIHKEYEIPSFDGRSYVRLKPLKAYHKLSIEVEFKTYSNDGIILYNQQKADGMGDFVSLAIVNGLVEFRYNLGNGPVVITSLDKVQLKKFHRVVIKRYHRDGMLKLDEGEDVAGQSTGSLRALDLVEDAFIGFVPSNHSRVYENIGIDRGLQGCIRKLKIGRKTVELHEHGDEWVIKVDGVHECGENPCSSVPCQNGGVCKPIDSELYRCECRAEYTGDFCENIIDACVSNPCKAGSTCDPIDNGKYICKCLPGHKGTNCELVDVEVDISTPEFNGSSYIEFPRLEGVGKTFSIEVVFMSKVYNGLILYNGQLKNGRGDFISLALIHGHVQFRFNLGSGIANITSKETIRLGKWHWARVSRNGREGYLQLDNSSAIQGFSGPSLTELNLELSFYVGSVLSWQEVHRLAGVSKGFKGAIQRILLDGQPLPISGKPVECSFAPVNGSGCGFQVGIYDGDPCPLSKNPCQNKGLCIPNLNEYMCRCHSNFEGDHCEVEKNEITSIKFTGNTFLQYKNRGYRRRKGERGNKYEFKIKTFVPDGLLLWRSRNRNLKEEYFSLAIVDGHPEVSYNLGKQKAFWAVRSRTRVDDGEWHTIHVKRRKRISFISVDNEPPTKGISEKGAISLSTNSKLWIGGMPSLPPGLPSSYYKGFEGCVQHIIVNVKPLNMLKHSDSNIIKFCHDNEI